MGEVIQVAFGDEREWEQTRARLVTGFTEVGGRFGDDLELMRAKAEVVHQMLRDIIKGCPTIRISATFPDGLSAAQVETLTETIKAAAREAVEVGMTHTVSVVMAGIYDLCTSKLKGAK